MPRRPVRPALLLAAFFCLFLRPLPAAHAADASALLLIADRLDYDEAAETLKAAGNVQIERAGRLLKADTVIYDRAKDTVTATGNIVLHEVSGEVVFADHMELTGDLRDGVAERLRIALAGDARFAAARALRTGGVRTELDYAVYSPCRLCADTPGTPPLWQLKAREVVHDQQAQRIEYHDAALEMYGIPVAYLPYLSHPDPRAGRQTGFLPPRLGSSSTTGVFLGAPYFWAPDVDRDLTLEPVLTQSYGPMLIGEYRQLFDDGAFSLEGSLVDTPDQGARGHVLLDGSMDIDDSWRWGGMLHRLSDRTYLDVFPFFGSSPNSLTSRVYAERFGPDDYGVINAYSFQNLRADDAVSPPVILPLAEYSRLGERDSLGGRWSFQSGLRGLRQQDVSRSVRISAESGYTMPLVTDAPFLSSFSASLHGDLYQVWRDAPHAAAAAGEGVLTGRLLPRASVDWRYPLFRAGENADQIIVPVAALFVAPTAVNPAEIPNDDSILVEEDDTNLFSRDRLSGLDRVESGVRAAYGVKFGQYAAGAGPRMAEIFLGQSYRLSEDAMLARETGLQEGVSDLFGRMDLVLDDRFRMNYRFRFDAVTARPVRQEVRLLADFAPVRLSGTYLFLKQPGPPPAHINQLFLNMNVTLSDTWSARLYNVHDLEGVDGRNTGPLANGLSLVYDDECFSLTTSFKRTYVSRISDDVNNTVLFSLVFKTLGAVGL